MQLKPVVSTVGTAHRFSRWLLDQEADLHLRSHAICKMCVYNQQSRTQLRVVVVLYESLGNWKKKFHVSHHVTLTPDIASEAGGLNYTILFIYVHSCLCFYSVPSFKTKGKDVQKIIVCLTFHCSILHYSS